MDLKERIQSLDEERAILLLDAFARGQTPGSPAELTPALAESLRASMQVDTALGGAVSKGDVARTALLLLASDPHNEGAISSLVTGPQPKQFVVLETAAVVTAVLVVLGTHVKFARGKDGRYSIEIEKRPTDSRLLTELVRKVLLLK